MLSIVYLITSHDLTDLPAPVPPFLQLFVTSHELRLHRSMAMDDIAVVGIGLRFPGNAASTEELWKVLERGESQWSEFPDDRLNIDGYFHPSGDRQGSVGPNKHLPA